MDRKEYGRVYRLAHKDRISKYGKEYKIKNKSRIQKRDAEYQRKIRLSALENLGGKCVRCGLDDYRVLQIDHINGGGSKDRKDNGDTKIYRQIAKGETIEYQLLCANCNWIKRYENQEHGSVGSATGENYAQIN